ncbi:aryl-sulfate sulfotransferase, partial [Duodenibacillus massiliensis]|uniref:aryl-sulfate sulfotransferase n=1 Tax=Duodenibacillus massiliensis TaxID=1852381 RepID=UPI00307CB15C
RRSSDLNFMGKIVGEHDLPRGYIDMSHASWEMPNGHILLRAAKANYLRPDGQKVHTVRDHILEVDRSGNLIDVWDLNKILDNTRDDLIKNLDLGAVCMNVDVTAAGQKVANEPEAPFGDAPGVGAGRNWAHVNSVAYDPSDDSIIISARHQGVVKIGRDKEVKWILAPHTGWKNGLEKKLLTPVDKNGKPIKCTPMGECEGNFDFTYTQHAAWPSASGRGNLTVFDNGQIRHYEQPPLPDMNYSRIVEYKIDPVKMTVQQTWEFGKEKGVDWFAAITSNVQWQKDRDTMFAFWGSVGIFNPKTGTIGRISEQDYKTKGIKVQIDVHNDKPASTHYQAHVFDPEKVFAR